MRLCTYVVRHDSGLAPNPFWGHCTLAVCTPNHMGVKAQPGDWFMGITTGQRRGRLVNAMEVSETLPFEQYAIDPRFGAKKPILNGPWQQRCGDNLYYRDEKGEWQQRPSHFHNSDEFRRKDIRYPMVFIGTHFFYFGENAPAIPPEFEALIWQRRGCKCSHDPQTVKEFINWLQGSFALGIHGEPFDRPRAKDMVFVDW